MNEIVDKILDNHKYKRKVLDNSGTPQVSLDHKGNNIVGIDDEAIVDLRFSEKFNCFYWAVYPPGSQPAPKEVKKDFSGGEDDE